MADMLTCWEWQGAKTGAGYGRVKISDLWLYAHRVSYERWHGPIPDGLEIDHLCRNTSCVNPLHLEAVTHRENIRRGMEATRATHCPQGHPMSMYSGSWRCRTCHIVRSVEYNRRRRAAARG